MDGARHNQHHVDRGSAKMKNHRGKFDGLGSIFHRASARTAQLVGSPFAFLGALAAVILWGSLGRKFHYSDTWQLVINTGTTIVTFLMVFLIQNTQNRDAKAIHLKLDEIVRATHDADNRVIDAENLSDTDLLRLMKNYEKFRSEYERRAGGTKHAKRKA
jgi:low affinity Fe/Cu permease